jgi:hypothetical protein
MDVASAPSKADHVFLVRAAAAPDIIECPRAAVDGQGGHPVELRNLASVQRQLGASRLLAWAPAGALVVSNCGRRSARDHDFGGHARHLQGEP